MGKCLTFIFSNLKCKIDQLRPYLVFNTYYIKLEPKWVLIVIDVGMCWTFILYTGFNCGISMYTGGGLGIALYDDDSGNWIFLIYFI